MNRRQYLQTTATLLGVGGVAGCLEDSPTALDSLYDIESEELSFPANGETLPSVEVPAPLHDTTISTDEFVGERETLLAFIFTRCPDQSCHAMVNAFANVQSEARYNDYEDEVALMPITFDPEYDTAGQLASFSQGHQADPYADSWYALRPETPEDAEAVVRDTFGVWYEAIPADDADDGEHEDAGYDLDAEEQTFAHVNLIILANRDGYVERSYFGDLPSSADLIEDLRKVRSVFA